MTFQSNTTSISEQAARWLIDFEAGSVGADDRRAFLEWLRQSPQHIKEFLQIAALDIELARNERLAATIEEIVAAAQSEVIEFTVGSGALENAPAARPADATRKWIGMAATVLLTVSAGGWFWYNQAGDRVGEYYRTDIGEQRSIALTDGSMITLNTLSEIRVSFNGEERRVTLVDGEALFDVKKDATRPFRVEAGPMALTVLGTQFNVYRQASQTVLTVVEGAVGVAAAEPNVPDNFDAAAPALTARSGDRIAIASSGDIVKGLEADVARVTAWTARKLIFDEQPLARVIDEFNRYNRTPLRIDDPDVAQQPITGVFNAHDTDVLTKFLRNQPSIRIEESPDVIRVKRADR